MKGEPVSFTVGISTEGDRVVLRMTYFGNEHQKIAKDELALPIESARHLARGINAMCDRIETSAKGETE